MALVETVKVNLSVPSPLAGRVVEVNADLPNSPEFVNQDPYGRGWLAVLEIEDAAAVRRGLMSAAEYMALARVEAEAETRR